MDMKAQLPRIVQLFIDGFGNTTFPCGRQLKFCMARHEYLDDEETDTFGWFSKIDESSHYLYSNYPCLAVYAMHVSQNIAYTNFRPQPGPNPPEFDINWNLPTAIGPNNQLAGKPTINLLGYAPAAKYTPQQCQWIKGAGFNDERVYLSVSDEIPLIVDMLIAVQMEINAINKITKQCPSYGISGSQAQVHLTVPNRPTRHQPTATADVVTNAPLEISGALTILDGGFTYRVQHNAMVRN
ncbi:hypothetical protein PUN28_018414 [Cardiocondyla obscurior]|uniref:Uncharacterized protein n=1 Tax=Cardiocondyla obscurior TaxID=286306 RepID=A0AAW2EF63_9HYME